jgi:hypothetical protein
MSIFIIKYNFKTLIIIKIEVLQEIFPLKVELLITIINHHNNIIKVNKTWINNNNNNNINSSNIKINTNNKNNNN